MKHLGNKVEELNIAYIGGGSRGWAWVFMSDLSKAHEISGTVRLYDIDFPAAAANETIGNRIGEMKGGFSNFTYEAHKDIDSALDGADFVIISILPGTFDEMESDVHAPEAYDIYQSVGDTTGPGGLVRGLRTVPMFEEIAHAVKRNCPDAWVINYTNPMALCTRTLHRAFPGIKAYGCCHEVLETQRILKEFYRKEYDCEDFNRNEVKVNIIGVNHFTWLTEAKCRGTDMFDLFAKVARENPDGYKPLNEQNWANKAFKLNHKVKFDLFERYGYIPAAGDRHLAEFCPGSWYLKNPETVDFFGFGLTPVSWRKKDLEDRLKRSERILNKEENIWFGETGEEGVNQIKALLGLGDLVTNVNLPNEGQIPNLPYDAVVETNAVFTTDSVRPVYSGNVPACIHPLIAGATARNEAISDAATERDLHKAYAAFVCDPLVTIPLSESKKLFDIMIDNTKAYLTDYFK